MMLRQLTRPGAALAVPVSAALVALTTAACSGDGTSAAHSGQQDPEPAANLVGSASCRSCHERFHELWSTSHHGLAMQPFTAEFAAQELGESGPDVVIGEERFAWVATEDGGHVVRRDPAGDEVLPVEQAMGGKNVYFLLTPRDRGRLQVLPIAYDVGEQSWYDTTGSMVRHLRTDIDDDTPLHWTDSLLTFNTSCYRCHVSQLQTNYDVDTDSYRTTWAEPGINCETCHGPCGEHVMRCRAAGEGNLPTDLAVLRYSGLSIPQRNANCASCHLKGMAISRDFVPGDVVFDHFDLVTLEDPDFYPDGRDLGENYTMTTWLQSGCAQAVEFDCIHCHTSSGRYRFADPEVANQACLPCHEERVANAAAHHRHPEGGPGSFCRDCHMPMTTFARMRRSDHSMRPPIPAATREFGSPNACNLCHEDEDVEWAERIVAEWHPDSSRRDEVMRRGRLVADARAGRWGRLEEMLACITGEERDEVLATSLIRLLGGCADRRKVPALQQALEDPSPLVRSAAVTALTGETAPAVQQRLLAATGDPLRLVRVRAAAALAGLPRTGLSAADREQLAAATEEYVQSLKNRPDDWVSHHNLGNFHDARGEPEKALANYELAAKLRSDVVAPLVNASMLHAQAGRNGEAEKVLRRAIARDPTSAAANFNLGLLLAEQGDLTGAEKALRAALKGDPDMAAAAYNLGVLLAEKSPEESVALCRRAVAAAPQETRYAYTLAFYLDRSGDAAGAIEVLQQAISQEPPTIDPYVLLIQLLQARDERAAAASVADRAFANPGISEQEKRALQARLR